MFQEKDQKYLFREFLDDHPTYNSKALMLKISLTSNTNRRKVKSHLFRFNNCSLIRCLILFYNKCHKVTLILMLKFFHLIKRIWILISINNLKKHNSLNLLKALLKEVKLWVSDSNQTNLNQVEDILIFLSKPLIKPEGSELVQNWVDFDK